MKFFRNKNLGITYNRYNKQTTIFLRHCETFEKKGAGHA